MSKLMSYKDEVSDSEFKTILDETYLTSPKDMVLAVSIAKSYPDAIKTGQIEKIPIDSPYVQSTYIDYHYHGFCTVISFTELLKSFKNLNSSVEKDTSFFTVVWLKVCILTWFFVLKLLEQSSAHKSHVILSNLQCSEPSFEQ